MKSKQSKRFYRWRVGMEPEQIRKIEKMSLAWDKLSSQLNEIYKTLSKTPGFKMPSMGRIPKLKTTKMPKVRKTRDISKYLK